MKSYLLILLISTVTFAGSRINPGATEGARPIEYRAGVYLDQNFPLPLTQNDVVSTKITMSQSGWYALSENITGDIEITGDNVKLDFNGYTLYGQLNIKSNYVTIDLQGGFVYANKTGILVNTGSHDILVMNGTVDLSTATTGDTDCLSIAGALGYECYNITIQDMFIKDFPTRGINTKYTNEITISRCHVTGTSSLETFLYGISCENVQRGVIADCSIMQLTNTNALDSSFTIGIYIYESDNIYVYANQVIDLETSGSTTPRTFGIVSAASKAIIFDHCIIQNIAGPYNAFGIFINCGPRNIIQDCIVNTITAATDVYPVQACGILLVSNLPITLSTIECNVTGNLVGIVTGGGSGVGGSSAGIADDTGITNNVFTQNIAFNNDTNYANVSNVESGYDGTQPNLNVALPNTP